jgi:hypothetical protein
MLSVKPDIVWKVGELRGNTRIAETDCGVAFEVKGDSASCNEFLFKLKERTEKIYSDLIDASKSDAIDIQLSCIVYSEYSPELNFDAEDIEWLSSLGASLDIQSYGL